MVVQIVLCESGGNEYAEGDCDENGKNCKANGIAQFHERTFYWLAGLANLEHPNYWSTQDQLTVLRFALLNGYGKEWSCYRKLNKH